MIKIRITVETLSPNGTRDVRSEDFSGNELVLGRGAGSNIFIDHHSVSFTHAKLQANPDGVVRGTGILIEDANSLSGVLVNQAPVRSHELALGDVIALGSVQFTVRDANGVVELYRELKAESLDLESKIRRDVLELFVTRRLPSFQIISLIFVALVLVGYFVVPVVTERKMSWSSGEVSSGHKMIEHDCHACHDGVFSHISDQKCVTCHQLTDHTPLFAAHAKGNDSEPRCAQCHFEHNGPHGLIVPQSALCSDCHASIEQVRTTMGVTAAQTKKILEVAGFDTHPEFAVTLQPERPSTAVRRVRLDEPAKLKDISNIKLNHKVHLQENLRTRKGRKTLDCQYCHTLSSDFRTITPITFEKNCQECHSLEFDERLPGVEVPHGDPKVVYRFLYSEYAKLLLSSEKTSPARKEFQQRGGRIPGRVSPEQVQQAEVAKSADDFSRGFVEQEARGAERGLFTRTACYLCHAVQEAKIPELQLREGGLSRFQIVKPQIPDRWMPASIFSHGSHEEAECESCHQGVRQSTRTADVLLPKIALCRDCHTQHPVVGKVTSDCIMCHSYHDSQPMPDQRKRPLNEIIAGLKL